MTGPRLSRVDMDAVAPLLPHDKTAAVVGGKGVHYEFKTALTRAHSATPLPTRPIKPQEWANPSFVDLTGKHIGRFRVVGIAEKKTGDSQNWVVRCVCGTYEMRKSKFLKQCIAGTAAFDAMCAWCAHTKRLQRGKGSKSEERKWREVLGEDFPR